MFKIAFQAVLLTLVIDCLGDPLYAKEIMKDNPYLVGEWTGEARLMDEKRNLEYGPMDVQLEIGEKEVLSAKIGDAELIAPQIANAKYGFLVKGKLSSSVRQGKPLDKPYAYILLVFPESERESPARSEANFHLKSNRFFDVGMFVGGMVLERN